MPDEGGGVGADPAASTTTVVKSGDRQRFTVELRPDETTIVSWKKLIKEANKANGSVASASVVRAPLSSDVLEEPRIPPPFPPQGAPTEVNLKDEPPANRFNAVIEKIERLYKGNDTSDEDLNDVPDDDQYDTEDSFIDDAELDEYFQVDNCSTKHNGFFVNKGKLEAVKESPVLPAEQPKKRRRKDVSVTLHNDGPLRKKQGKLDKVATEAPALASKQFIPVTLGTSAAESRQFEDRRHQSSIKRKSADSLMDHAVSSKPSNGTSLVGQAESKIATAKHKHEQQSKMPVNRVKDASGHSDPARLKNDSRSHADSQSDKRLISVDGLLQPVKHKKKSGNWEMKETHISDGKHAQAAVYRKDGSNIKTKATLLEKAIRELERMVAESRPPTMEVPDADVNGQAVKRRLPRDLKQKLAKVARLAQANDGEVSEEVVNRLMGFLGHTMQLRTLKRNLRMMISSSLSANQEKEARFQQMKREAIELITKELEQHARMANNTQEFGSDGKEANKKKFTMSVALEDKICDLYDLYIEGLEEDSTREQVRKLYDELEGLWPRGLMDGTSIKRAIYRSKDRRRAVHQQNKDSPQIKKKKVLTPNPLDKGKLGMTSTALRQEPQPLEKQTTDPGLHVKMFSNNLALVSTLALEAPRPNAIIHEKLKRERVKASPNSDFVDDVHAPLVKKKLKRMPEGEACKVHIRPEKLPAQGDERPKPQKQQLPVIAQRSSSAHSSASAGV